MIDILVLNYNDSATTAAFVNTVKDFSNVEHVLIVDNKSTDRSVQKLNALLSSKVILLESDHNGGYGAGNNLGIRYLNSCYKSQFVLLANPDVFVDEKTILRLEDFLRHNSDYTIAAPFMMDSYGKKMKNTAFRIPSKWEYIASLDILFSKYIKSFVYPNILNENSEIKRVDALTGSLFMMNVADMLEYGMYDENVFLYCEELILGKKLAKAGKKAALLVNETFVHHHSVSVDKAFGKSLTKHKLYLKSKLYVLKNYYNANFFERLMAFVLTKISLIEVALIYFFRKFK
jgi:GT2 family glycosyltransferase